jgi:RNA polymerase sigma-70 factor (ECF subfamily)
MITRSLDLLDDEYREAFILREYSGLSYKELAEVTGISVANAKSRVFRAKERIKHILKPVLKDLSN